MLLRLQAQGVGRHKVLAGGELRAMTTVMAQIYGYRSKSSCHTALQVVETLL